MPILISHEAMNAKLELIVPEIAASKYGKYPMQETRWLQLTELTSEGNPTFLKGPNAGPKTDYAYGLAPYGEAYYHLLTKPAYTALFNRIMKEAPSSLCPCFLSNENRKSIKDHEDVLEVLLFRSRASIPDDKQAAQDALLDAQHATQAQYE